MLVPEGKLGDGIYNTVSELFFLFIQGSNMKMHGISVRSDSVNWIYLIQNRVQ